MEAPEWFYLDRSTTSILLHSTPYTRHLTIYPPLILPHYLFEACINIHADTDTGTDTTSRALLLFPFPFPMEKRRENKKMEMPPPASHLLNTNATVPSHAPPNNHKPPRPLVTSTPNIQHHHTKYRKRNHLDLLFHELVTTCSRFTEPPERSTIHHC